MLFSLDIGTRFLVGILMEGNEDKITIKDWEIREHENRAMLDGQIHDVMKVAKGVKYIKEKLEEKIGKELKKVAVALAGRFLMTSLGEAYMNFESRRFITPEMVRSIELESVKNAIDKLENRDQMYCVGYSVLYYEIDGEWIKHLEGQKGEKIYVKTIAAFLPKNVVDAMFSVLEINDLEPIHVTLEPIAAMNLVVPEDLRNLNIAMVDVGAGTSDIAVSKDGTVIGYGMVPMAGDEISEAISREFLVDFKTAEWIKRSLGNGFETFKFKDILDFEQEIHIDKVRKVIEPVINEITNKISEKILELNGKPPVAVFVVGGGAKVPSFVEKLAEKLGLPKNRIALKDIKNVPFVSFENKSLEGSEFITPVGIGYVAMRNEGSVFAKVIVNGKPVNMMFLGSDMNVMQVLLQAGYKISDLIGKPAPAITFEINGKMKIFKGELGKEAPVKINGKPATLHSKVLPGDQIEVGKPQNGKMKYPTVKEAINPIKVFVDGVLYRVYPRVYRDDGKLTLDDVIKDNDKLVTRNPLLSDLLEVMKENSQIIEFTVNGVEKRITLGKIFLRKDTELTLDSELENGDILETKEVDPPRVVDIIDYPEINHIEVAVNGNPFQLPSEEIIIKVNGIKVNKDYRIKDGDMITIEKSTKLPTIFDLLARLNIDISNIKRYEMYVNSEKINSFSQILKAGDDVRIVVE